MNKGKIKITVLIVICVVIFAIYSFLKNKNPDKVNVVFIVIDTLRADHLSAYGYHKKTSPYMDNIAKEALLFEHFYATSCWTLPSHASLFTGLYPLEAGATSETLLLPMSNNTLAEVLQQNGYQTFAYVCNSWLAKDRGFGQGFTEYNQMWQKQHHHAYATSHQQLEDASIDKMLKQIDQLSDEAPFFMFANLNGVHLPYKPPEANFDKFVSETYLPENIHRCSGVTSWWAHLTGHLELSAQDYQILSDLYDAEINYIDHQVGQIYQKLRDKNLLDNTLFVITSDHGENLGEHGRIDHMMSMYDTTLHVPLIVKLPKGRRPGDKVSALVSMVDLAPAVLATCHIESDRFPQPDNIFSPDTKIKNMIFASNEKPVTGIALLKSRYPEYDANKIDYKLRAIRTKPNKFIWNVGRDLELYDMTKDKDELVNIANRESQKAKKMQQILKGWTQQLPTDGKTTTYQSKDAESLKRLKALGYIE